MMNVGEWEDYDDDGSHGDDQESVACGGWRIDSFPKTLLGNPLDLIFADHIRQRQAALLLNRVSNGEFNETGVRDLIAFLETDFAQHVADEELAVFPQLKIHCLPEDNIDPLIKRLMDEHRDDETIGDEIVLLLKKRLAGSSLAPRELRRIRHFAEHIRQHLAVENGVLLPIARVRMDDAALKTLSDNLKARRRLG